MTTNRDFDQMARAWLDLMPDEAPDRLIVNVRLAVDVTPQLRGWRRLAFRRSFPMNRLSLIAAVAVLAIALVGGAMILTSGHNGPSQPTAAPTASPTPVASVAAPTTPAAVRSWWVANAPSGSAGSVITLEITDALISVRDAGNETVLARPAAASGGELAIEATDANHGCQKGDLGRYGFAFGRPESDPDAGDMQLAITATAEACPARQAILERTWTRVFTDGFQGGRAVAIDFAPKFMITLPTGAYAVTQAGTDALMVEGLKDGDAPGVFVATRNPAGYSDPCSETGGSKVQVAHTADAFATYMDSLPGFTVQRTNVEIGGLPAVHLTIPTQITADCPRADHRVIEWSTSDPTFRGNWILGQGDATDTMYLVEVGNDLYLFQWLTPSVDETLEMSILSTITFISTIPD